MTQRGESELGAHGFFWEDGLHFPLTKKETTKLVSVALEEDDTKHDITTAATVKSTRRARCRLVSRQAGVIAGVNPGRGSFQYPRSPFPLRFDPEGGLPVPAQTPGEF